MNGTNGTNGGCVLEASDIEEVGEAPERIHAPSVPEIVLQRLRHSFLNARFRPGDPIRVDQMAAELGVSAVPVREALRVLSAEGRVIYTSRKGYTVASLSAGEVEELFLICGLLESEALKRGVPALDAADVGRMRQLHDEMERTSTRHALWRKVQVHQDFHFIPIERAGLTRVAAELRRLWGHTDHYRGLYSFVEGPVLERMTRQHRELMDACQAGDAAGVVRIMDEHRATGLAGLAESLGPVPATSGEEAR